MSQPLTTLTPAALADRIDTILRIGGLSPVQAGAAARTLAAGERDGCKSHGIYRIEGALRTVRAGKVDPQAEPVLHQDATAVVRVDARRGFSNAALELGLPALAEAARRHGIAALAINDCVHFAALWPEIEVLTAQGLAGLALCPSYATVAPFGGNKPLLGTNPMAFGWPRPAGAPFVFDFATSVAARGEIELHRRAGKPIPEGWAIDAEGLPTTDPTAALAGAMLPFGAHKGGAIGLMVELLAGALIGDRTSAEALDALGTTTLIPQHGELVLAFDPAVFARGRTGDPLQRAEALFDAVLGQGARLPSGRRFAARAKVATEGIPLTAAELAWLDRMSTAEGQDQLLG